MRFFHFLGEVEAVFGIWVLPLILLMNLMLGRSTTIGYLNGKVNYTEAVFVVIIMAIASTRPVLRFAESLLRLLARLGKETPAAWWFTLLIAGPMLAHKAEEGGRGRESFYIRLIGACIGLNLVLCLGLLYADYRQADIYRDFARKIEKGRYLGRQAYFDGNWGFWFYMDRSGAKRTAVYGNPVETESVFIRPTYSSPKALEQGFLGHLQPVGEERYSSRFPLRVLGKSAQAGFYSQVWGFLPYSFSTDPLDTFCIYRYRQEDLLQGDMTGAMHSAVGGLFFPGDRCLLGRSCRAHQ